MAAKPSLSAALVVVLLLSIHAAGPVRAESGTAPGNCTSAASIRAARAQFNAAIGSQDAGAIGGFLAPGYHIVTGRSAQSHGVANEVESWRKMFLADPSFRCMRTPDGISVNEGWGLAQESGHWVCTYQADGEPVRSNGVYAAKWQRAENGRWLLQTEVFTTLECKGRPSGCMGPDPITE